jgi:hypothetical protein
MLTRTLPAAAGVIDQRLTQLALDVHRDGPAWSPARQCTLGLPCPSGRMVAPGGIMAGYREQHQITDKDLAAPEAERTAPVNGSALSLRRDATP